MISRGETDMAQAGQTGQRLRLAYFSPLPPAPTGIADYSRELLPYLSRSADVTVFIPDPAERPEGITHNISIRPISDYAPLRMEFDLPLYQMGNSFQHEFVYQQALRYPGVVVLHEYYLHHLLVAMMGSEERYGAYVRELGYAFGQPGVEMAWQIRYGQVPYPLFSLPLNNRLLDRSLGLLVHSKTTASRLRQQAGRPEIGIVPQLMTPRAGESQRQKLPASLGITPETVIFASIGQVTASKRLDLALRSFARLLDNYPESSYLIVGQEGAGSDLDDLIESLGLSQVVYRTGYVAGLNAFGDWTSTADIIINLRQPTLGETSAAVLRAMAASRPTIVFNHGWYSELPEETCTQVPLQDEDALYEAMITLVRSPQRRRAIGQRAADYVKNELAPETCAAQYLTFLNGLLMNLNRQYSEVDSV